MDIQDFIFLYKLGQKVLEFNSITFKKVVDGAGKVFVKFIGDNGEEVYTLDTPVLTLDNGFVLVNKDEEVGLGYPSYRLVSAADVLPVLQDSDFISDGDSISVDLDGDGACDEVIRPVPYDGDGDGVDDFEIIVDDDDNGLPDVSPYSPFYPIGSEGYQEILETYSDNVPALDKSFHKHGLRSSSFSDCVLCLYRRYIKNHKTEEAVMLDYVYGLVVFNSFEDVVSWLCSSVPYFMVAIFVTDCVFSILDTNHSYGG